MTCKWESLGSKESKQWEVKKTITCEIFFEIHRFNFSISAKKFEGQPGYILLMGAQRSQDILVIHVSFQIFGWKSETIEFSGYLDSLNLLGLSRNNKLLII